MSPFSGQVLDIQAQLKKNQVTFEHITLSFLPLDLFPPPLPVPSLSFPSTVSFLVLLCLLPFSFLP